MLALEAKSYRFGNFVVDARSACLRRDNAAVPLRPKSFDVLLYLVRNRGRLVTKNELVENVWSDVIVTDNSLVQCIKEVRQALGDDEQRIVETVAKRGYVFTPAVLEGDEVNRSVADPPAGISDRASIAVLPFANLSSDPEQDYFTDGIVEDIITALSRNRAFFVIARNSSFTYKGMGADIKQVGRELGVRYVLEGSVRKLGARVRVTGQLIDAASGHHLWADKFDGDVADIFELQDQIVTRAVGAIAPQLEKAEINRAKRGGTGDLAAYDLYLRGLASWNRWTKEENAKALQLFNAAIDKDRDYSTPCGLAISCYVLGKASGWLSDINEKEISRLVDRASAIGVDDPVALCWAGHALAFFFKDVERGLLLIDRALDLDQNLAIAWQRSGWVRGYAGEPDRAIESLNRAIRLNPLDPRMFLAQSAMAFAHFIAARDDEAADWAATALRSKPNWPSALRMAIAANAMRGRLDDARQALTLHLRAEPRLTIAKVCDFYPLRRDVDRHRLIVAMRKAGVPE